MPYALIGTASIHYQILGDSGPFVVAMSGGRRSIDEIDEFAKALAGLEHRVLLYDRRNCGHSSLNFIDPRPEETIWADDLCRLLDHLGIRRAFVVGRSRTTRVAIEFALRHPERVLTLGLWGLAGGKANVRFLDHHYFGQYIQARRNGGMPAVCDLDHFQQLIMHDPDNMHRLLTLDPDVFEATLNSWRAHFLRNAHSTVMGLPDATLRRIQTRLAIVPKYDRLHPFPLSQYAHDIISVSTLFDFRPDLHDNLTSHDDQTTVARILSGYFAQQSPDL